MDSKGRLGYMNVLFTADGVLWAYCVLFDPGVRIFRMCRMKAF